MRKAPVEASSQVFEGQVQRKPFLSDSLPVLRSTLNSTPKNTANPHRNMQGTKKTCLTRCSKRKFRDPAAPCTTIILIIGPNLPASTYLKAWPAACNTWCARFAGQNQRGWPGALGKSGVRRLLLAFLPARPKVQVRQAGQLENGWACEVQR